MPDHTISSTPIAPPNDASKTQLVQWAIGRISAQDLDSLRTFWTVDTTVYFPTGTCHGHAEIAAYFEQVFAALADFTLEIVSVAESGHDVLVHWHLTGQHVGAFMGIAGTGRHIDLEGFDHFVVENGHVVTNTVRYDQMEFARQIKLLPADGSVADRALKAVFNGATRARHLACSR